MIGPRCISLVLWQIKHDSKAVLASARSSGYSDLSGEQAVRAKDAETRRSQEGALIESWSRGMWRIGISPEALRV